MMSVSCRITAYIAFEYKELIDITFFVSVVYLFCMFSVVFLVTDISINNASYTKEQRG